MRKLSCVASALAALLQTVQIAHSEPQSFDLGSSETNHQAQASKQLTLGDQTANVQEGSPVTAAMYVAIQDLLAGATTQSLVLDSRGVATGGHFQLANITGNLNIPVNVSAFANAATNQSSVSGLLTNFGNIYAFSTSNSSQQSIISAAGITNQSSGFIGTQVPVLNGLPLANATANINLMLSTTGALTNFGTISSLGSLDIVAGGGVTNSAASIMQAVSNVNIYSSVGQIVNSGLISSATGSVNLASSINSALVLTNLQGTIQALNNSISLTSPSGTAVIGGDLISQVLDVVSESGPVAINANEITGLIDVVSTSVTAAVGSGELRLGSICVNGDPTFYNTVGGVQINSDLSFPGQPLAIVASGNITVAPGAGKISTASTTGNSANILMLAGVDFTTTGGPTTTDPFAPVTLLVKGASASGGSILLDGANGITALTARSTGPNGKGGDVNLNAFAGAVPGSGQIRIPENITVFSGGNGSGANGRIRMIGGATSGTAVIMGDGDATGGATGTGQVVLLAATPEVTAGGASIVNGDLVVPASIFAATGNTKPASIIGGHLKATGGTIFAVSLADVFVKSINADGIGAGGTVRVDSVSKSPFIVGPGAKSPGPGIQGPITARGGAAGGKGGSISLNIAGDGGLILESPALINVDAINGAGGTIVLGNAKSDVVLQGNGAFFVAPGTISANGAGANANGGSITITYRQSLTVGTPATPGGAPLILRADATGTGTGGNVLIKWVGPNGESNNTDLIVGNTPGGIMATARGGSAGSANGAGGRIEVEAGRNLTVDPAAIDANPRGTNGAGGQYRLYSGKPFYFFDSPGGPGKLTINGDLRADGKGAAPGGILFLAIGDPSSFNVGVALGCSNCVAGSLSANAGTSGAGGSVRIESFGDLNIINGSNISALATNGNGGTIGLSLGGGTISIGSGSLSVNAVGAAGSNFTGGSLIVQSLYLNTGSGLTLSANGAGIGAGGSVFVEAPGSVLSVNAAGSSIVSISATGGTPASSAGNGGKVYVASKQLTVNPAAIIAGPVGTNGKGASIELRAVNGLTINGNIDVSGKGTGGGGTILLSTAYANTPDSNRYQLILYGKINVSSPDPFTVNSAIPGCQNCTTGKLIADSGATGPGGSITVSNTNTLTVGSVAANFSLVNNSGSGAKLVLESTTGSLEISSGTINLSANGAGAINGGTIMLSGATLNIQGGLLTLIADAKGTGTGGTISVAATGANSDLITGGFTASALGGSSGSASGKGGSITVAAGRDLTIDPSLFQVAPQGTNGDGGTLTYTAGRTLTILSSLNVNGKGTGAGGAINLSGNSSSPFTIGGAGGCTGCIAGSLSANAGASASPATPAAAGTIFVSNAGGVIVSDYSKLQLSTAAGNGGALTLTATNGAVSLPDGSFSVNGAGTGNFNGGAIAINAGSLAIQGTGKLSLSANAVGSGKGGQLSITLTKTSQNFSLSTSSLSLSATGGSAGSAAGDGGAVLVSTSDSLTVSPSALVVAPLGTNGKGGTLNLSAKGALKVSGSLITTGKGTGAGGTIVLSTGTNDILIGGSTGSSYVDGDLIANSTGTGAGGSISILGPNNGSTLTATVTGKINASATGNITFASSGSQPLTTVVVSNSGLITGIVNASAKSITLSMPQAPNTISLGTVTASNGGLQITIPSINIPNGAVVSAVNGSVAIQSGKIVNNGIIRATTPGYSVIVQNPAGITITGAGVILGSSVVFLSSGGSVNVSQGGIVGSISGAAAGAFNVGQSVLTTSGSSNTFVTTQAATVNTLTFALLQPISIQLVQQEQALRKTSFNLDQDNERATSSGGNNKAAKVSGEVVYVTHVNQALTGVITDDNSLAFADQDTLVSQGNGVTILHKGRMVVDTGEKGVIVQTAAGRVEINQNSTMLVEAPASGKMKVLALSGSSKLEIGGESKTLESGKEFIAGADLSEDEMVPADGIPCGEWVSASMTRARAYTRVVSLKKVVDLNVMISGSLVHIGGARPKAHQRYIGRVSQSANLQEQFVAIQAPVRKLETVTQPHATTKNSNFAQSSLSLFANENAQFQMTEQGDMAITSGAITFSAPQDMKITTPLATVDALKGTCISIEASSDQTKVRSLSGMKSVKVHVGQSTVLLSGGEELVVSSRMIVTTSDRISRRNSSKFPLGQHFGAMSEFSIPSFISSSSYMTALAHPSSPTSKQLQQRMLKTAAALQFAVRKGAYRSSDPVSMLPGH